MAKSKKPKTKKVIDEEPDIVEEPVEEEAPEADVEAETAEVEVDEDVAVEQEEEVVADVDEDAPAEVEDDDVVADVDDEAEEAKASEDDDKGDDDDIPVVDDEDEEPVAATPKLTRTTIVLLLLNWIITPLFLVIAFLDHRRHVEYSYRALLHHVAIWGIPLQSEDDGISLTDEARPVYRLTPDQLKAEFKKRPGAASFSEPFQMVEEPVPLRLRPSDMNDQLKRDIFGNDSPVATLDEEIKRVKGSTQSAIESAAKSVLEKQEKDENKKRDVVRKALYPIVWDIWQVKKDQDYWDDKTKEIKVKGTGLEIKLLEAKGSDLDALVLDAVERRLYYDILAPLSVYKPGDVRDPKDYKIERLADSEAYPLEKVRGFFAERLDGAIADQHNLANYYGEKVWPSGGDAMNRDTIEKRQTIAFILFAIGHTRVPVTDEPLINKGVDRASTVSGFYEFTNASINYVRAMRIIEQRLTDAIVTDRQGYLVAVKDKAELTRTEGFIDKYEREVDRLVKLVEQIDTAEKRREDLKKQRDQAQKTFDVRAIQHKDTMAKLLKSRKNTEKLAVDLRDLQKQLHEALIELSDAAERNFRLEAEIRAIELSYSQKGSKKGGQK